MKFKKICMLFGFFVGDLRQIPLSPVGDLKNPSGTLAGPRGFSNPLRASGDLAEDPLRKTRITYIYFFVAKQRPQVRVGVTHEVNFTQRCKY